MNNNDSFENIGIYLWVVVVGIIGGFLNANEKSNRSDSRKVFDLFLGLISSCFFGWIGFEFIHFLHQNERIALAGCGFFAWKGASWVEAVADKLIDKFLETKGE